MTAIALGERLVPFKDNEKPECVLIIADNDSLIRLVVAWTNTHLNWRMPETPCASSEAADVWQWLWKGVEYSQDELIACSACNCHCFDDAMRLLIGNRVIYPDGTVNSFVQRYLRERVLKALPATEAARTKARAAE